jgi:hypothetical protein
MYRGLFFFQLCEIESTAFCPRDVGARGALFFCSKSPIFFYFIRSKSRFERVAKSSL